MSSKQIGKAGNSRPNLVLRHVAIRSSFKASSAPPGVSKFIQSTEYPYKAELMNTMSGLFDHQIPGGRPEWWIVQDPERLVGLALVSYGQLNGERWDETYVGVEHLLVAQDHRNKGVGTKIIIGLRNLAWKDGLAGVNLESEMDLIPYYKRFGFVKRPWQPPGHGRHQFTKLVWKLNAQN